MFAVFLTIVACAFPTLILCAVIANMYALYSEAKRGVHHS